MPIPDPLPDPRLSMLWQLRRVVKGLALITIAVAAIAVLLGIFGTKGVPIQLLIATALGIGLTVLLGTAVMILTFQKSPSGHAEQARPQPKDSDQ